jgi:hypothetical protein
VIWIKLAKNRVKCVHMDTALAVLVAYKLRVLLSRCAAVGPKDSIPLMVRRHSFVR